MKFSIDIKPRGKDRPRFRRIGNYVQTYTARATQEYEKSIKKAFVQQCKDLCDQDYEGPIKVRIWALFEPSKSLSKKKRSLLIDMPHLKKPDVDNIAKCVLDALNGIAWKDDNQVAELIVHKYYDEKDSLVVEIEYV